MIEICSNTCGWNWAENHSKYARLICGVIIQFFVCARWHNGIKDSWIAGKFLSKCIFAKIAGWVFIILFKRNGVRKNGVRPTEMISSWPDLNLGLWPHHGHGAKKRRGSKLGCLGFSIISIETLIESKGYYHALNWKFWTLPGWKISHMRRWLSKPCLKHSNELSNVRLKLKLF
jgi:hypothetical protein